MVFVYVSQRPIGGENVYIAFTEGWPYGEYSIDVALEVTLWTMTFGYILYEIMDCVDRGLNNYFSCYVLHMNTFLVSWDNVNSPNI